MLRIFSFRKENNCITHPLLPLALLLLPTFGDSLPCFSFMDCLIKVTATDFAVGQVMFSRALFGLIPIFFLIPKNRLKDFYKTKHISLHFHRSFWGSIAMYAIFVGIRFSNSIHPISTIL